VHLTDILKATIAAILQRHVAAAVEEIAAAMADELDALAHDRLADLHPPPEPAESRASEDEQTLDRIEAQLLQSRQEDEAVYLAADRAARG